MARVAFMTFGILREPWGHPDVQSFVDVDIEIFAKAEGASGFIDRDRYPTDPTGNPFGEYATGRFVTPEFRDRDTPTLSLWADLESVFAFAYTGDHAAALRRRREWFVKPAWPIYVAWWVADDEWPDWRNANTRLEHLHDHGSTAFAFDFRSPFGADGQPIKVNQPRITAARAST